MLLMVLAPRLPWLLIGATAALLAALRRSYDGVCDAFELPFALGASARCLSRSALGSAATRTVARKGLPAVATTKETSRGSPGTPSRAPTEPCGSRSISNASQPKTGQPRAHRRARYGALRQPPTHTTATSAPATSSRTNPTGKSNPKQYHGQVHGLRRQGVRHEKGMAQVRDAPHVHLQGEDRPYFPDEKTGRC